jgi:PAS domain S-box-containing protein
MFRELSETCPVGIFHTDAQGRCIYTNPQWREIYGMSFEDALGDGWARGMHPADQAGVFVAGSGAGDQHRPPFDYSFRVLRPDRSVVHVRVRGAAIGALPDQSTGGYVGSVVDVSERGPLTQQQTARHQRIPGARRADRRRRRLALQPGHARADLDQPDAPHLRAAGRLPAARRRTPALLLAEAQQADPRHGRELHAEWRHLGPAAADDHRQPAVRIWVRSVGQVEMRTGGRWRWSACCRT